MPKQKKKIREGEPPFVGNQWAGKLTNRQRTFAKYYVEGIHTGKQCAIMAGFSEHTAAVYASKMITQPEYQHVRDYIDELREERERLYGVTLEGQLKRLHDLSKGAEENGQYSAAINAEKIRSALGGLTIDRRENINTLDQLSRDEITARLAALQKQYPQAFVIDGTAKDITPNGRTGSELLELTAGRNAQENMDGDED